MNSDTKPTPLAAILNDANRYHAHAEALTAAAGEAYAAVIAGDARGAASAIGRCRRIAARAESATANRRGGPNSG